MVKNYVESSFVFSYYCEFLLALKAGCSAFQCRL